MPILAFPPIRGLVMVVSSVTRSRGDQHNTAGHSRPWPAIFRVKNLVHSFTAECAEGSNMDATKLISIRDRLNADINTLVAASNVSQADVDNIVSEATALDADVVKALGNPNPPPAALNFSAFDNAVAAFKANTNIAQSDVDFVTANIIAATK